MVDELVTCFIALSCSTGTWCLIFLELVLGGRFPQGEVNNRKHNALLNAKGYDENKTVYQRDCFFPPPQSDIR